MSEAAPPGPDPGADRPTGAALADGWRLSVGTLTALPVRPPRVLDRPASAAGMLLAPVAALPLALVPLAARGLVAAIGMPHLLAAALTVAGLALASRGLHLDGLADTADGLAASYDRERALAVMRRGDVGPAGAATIGLVLLVQTAALSTLLATWAGATLAVVAVVGSRHTLAWLCGPSFPAARPEGLGATVAGSVPVWLAGYALAGLLALGGLGFVQAAGRPPWSAWAVLAAALAAALAVGVRARRRLGGVTGDVLGAGVELGLAAALAVAACLG